MTKKTTAELIASARIIQRQNNTGEPIWYIRVDSREDGEAILGRLTRAPEHDVEGG